MEALITSFVAAAVAGFGDPGSRIGQPVSGAAFAGLAIAILGVSLVAGLAGHLIHPTVTSTALSLLVALAIAYAGVVALLQTNDGRKAGPRPARSFLGSLTATAIHEAAGRTQFIIFALAARFDAPLLAGLGGAAGLIAAGGATALIEEGRGKPLPDRPIRLAGGGLFLLCSAAVALSARGLI